MGVEQEQRDENLGISYSNVISAFEDIAAELGICHAPVGRAYYDGDSEFHGLSVSNGSCAYDVRGHVNHAIDRSGVRDFRHISDVIELTGKLPLRYVVALGMISGHSHGSQIHKAHEKFTIFLLTPKIQPVLDKDIRSITKEDIKTLWATEGYHPYFGADIVAVKAILVVKDSILLATKNVLLESIPVAQIEMFQRAAALSRGNIRGFSKKFSAFLAKNEKI